MFVFTLTIVSGRCVADSIYSYEESSKTRREECSLLGTLSQETFS